MHHYLQEVNKLLENIQQGKATPGQLSDFFSQKLELYAGTPPLQYFFTAEQEFHRHDYENALKHYIQAKTVPLFQFFCYRVSAYIAQKRNHPDQALRFARKAYALQPEDLPTAHLLREILEQSGENENAQSIQTQYDSPFPHSVDDKDDANVSSYMLHDMSLPMNSPLSNSGIPPSNASLTRRFYGLEREPEISKPLQPSTQEPIMSITELDSPPHTRESLHSTAIDRLSGAEQALETRIQTFQRQKAQTLNQYLKRARQRKQPIENCIFVFNGWTNKPEGIHLPLEHEDPIITQFLLSNSMRKPTSGFYLKWNGKGIVVNPGNRFLEQFHKAGLHVTDIDMVIVTQADPDSYADVKEIYELNYQLNKINSELQIIHYYLNHKAHHELSHILKPNFKQERNAIHSLELFVDSSDVEKIDLSPEITLNYFPTSAKEALSHHHGEKTSARNSGSALGIRLDLKTPAGSTDGRRTLKIGYLSGTPWSPLLGHHMGVCDILFAGFGHTQLNDFSKLNYNESCLGYFGSYSLLDEVKPRLMFCCEFDGREGDIRLEVTKKMRQEFAHTQTTTSEPSHVILPADNGLYLDLKNLNIRCSVSQEMIDPAHVRVVKSGEAFSSLLYLSPGCLLE